MKYYHTAAVFILLLISGAVVWYASSLVNTLSDDEANALDRSLASATYQIRDYIGVRRDVARSFTDRNTRQLEPLTVPNTSEEYLSKMDAAMQGILKAAIPDFYSFLVRNASGHYTPDELDQKIGNLCREDMSQFLSTNNLSFGPGVLDSSRYLAYKPFIHPHPDRYHFDIVSPWQDESGAVHLFSLLFDPKGIANILKAHELPEHRLLLLREGVPTLIEITSQGDRSYLDGRVNLSTDELSRIYGRVLIPETGWEIAYIISETISEDTRRKVWSITIAIIIFLWILYWLSLRINIRIGR